MKENHIVIINLYVLKCAGVFLPDLCEKQRTNPHRAMLEVLSSGAAAGPVSSETSDVVGDAPAPSANLIV